jgi:hypothetical protein
LPGTLFCDPCSNNNYIKGIYSDNKNLLNLYPNPSSAFVNIEYNLPSGINDGEIIIYNLNGQEIKKYKVDNTFQNLNLNISDLSNGNYYYVLKTIKGISKGEKLIIMK